MVPGNHDDRDILRSTFGKQGCPVESEGKIDYVIEDSDLRLIALDSTLPGSPGGEITEAQASWLDARLNEKPTQPTMIFIDGNHTYRATLHYFEYFIERLNTDSFIVFDDIHWSLGMEEAWKKIIADKRITLSVDIFEMGIVFLRKGVEKQHFVIRF